MQLNFNFTASDIFVEKPYHRKYKQDSIHIFSKQNFMLNRLKHTPIFSLQYTLAKYIRNQKYKIVNIFEYIYTMGFLIKKYKDLKRNKENFDLKNILYTYIYKFFTNTYISITPEDKMYYYLDNGEIYFKYIQEIEMKKHSNN